MTGSIPGTVEADIEGAISLMEIAVLESVGKELLIGVCSWLVLCDNESCEDILLVLILPEGVFRGNKL